MNRVAQNKVFKDHGFDVSKNIASSIAEILSLKFNNFSLDENRVRMFKSLFKSITTEMVKKNKENMVFNRLICMSSIEYYKSLEMLMEKVFYNLADKKESLFKKAWFSDKLKFKNGVSKEEIDNAFTSIARWTIQKHFGTFLKTSTSEYRQRKRHLTKFLNGNRKLNNKNADFLLDSFIFLNEYSEYYNNFKEHIAQDIQNDLYYLGLENKRLSQSNFQKINSLNGKIGKSEKLLNSLQKECQENSDMLAECSQIFKENSLDTQKIISLKSLDEYFTQTLSFMKSVSNHNAKDVANYCINMQKIENKIDAQRRNSRIYLKSDIVDELSISSEINIDTSESAQEELEIESMIGSLCEEFGVEITTTRSIVERNLERRTIQAANNIDGLSNLEVPKPEIDGISNKSKVRIDVLE